MEYNINSCVTGRTSSQPEITNPDFHNDYCINCNKPIYKTKLAIEGEPEQWIHVFTGSHYCDSIRPNKTAVAVPKTE